MVFPGNGFKIANDVLTEISYVLVEPVVNTAPVSSVGPGTNVTVTPANMANIYAGAYLLMGAAANGNFEEIQVLTVTSTTFTANLTYAHPSGDFLYGATFPVGLPEATGGVLTNPFFTQVEMLQYLSDAENNYLTACPMLLTAVDQTFTTGATVGTIPADAIQIERIQMNGTSLQEQSQLGNDWLNYTWPGTAPSSPAIRYQDRVNFETYAIQPAPSATTVAELIYAQRDSQSLQLIEGFLLPDPFLTYVKYKVLAQCYGKEGEMRDMARARYCEQRWEIGIKLGRKFYENAQMQEVVNG